MSSITTAFRALGPIDLRNLMRDSLMRWMVFVPLVYAFMVRFIVPPLTSWLLEKYSFDLAAYNHLILAFMVVLATPVIFGFVIGLLLLDERDEDTLTALRVTPLPMTSYVIYKLSWPTALGFLLTVVGLWLANLTPQPIPWSAWLLSSATAALLTPWTALLIVAFARNKVEGFAMLKAMGGALLVLPVVAWFFLPMPFQWIAGILPTYWPARIYWSLLEGDWGTAAIAAVGAIVVISGSMYFFWSRFTKNLG